MQQNAKIRIHFLQLHSFYNSRSSTIFFLEYILVLFDMTFVYDMIKRYELTKVLTIDQKTIMSVYLVT